MSRTVAIEYRGRAFWAFDVVVGVFAKHLIDVAAPLVSGSHKSWLGEAVAQWRVNAVISDFGFFLDENWSQSQIDVLIELINESCRRLGERDEIPSREIEGWEIFDDLRIFPRGLSTVPTRPVIQLGRGIIAILDGSLPEAPPGTWWFYTVEDSPATIPMSR
jgi:hypothetical protein